MRARLLMIVLAAMLLFTAISWATAIEFGPFELIYLRHFSLLFAPVGLLFILLQFVFVSRIKAIEEGIGLDRMLRWHRFFGRAGLSLVLFHAIMIALYRLIAFGELFPTTFVWVGVAALLGFMITASLASTYKKLNLAYETWRNIHLINYLLFPFVLVHVFYHVRDGSLLYYLFVVLTAAYLAVILYRVIRIISIRRKPYEVVEVRQEANDIWTLFFKGPNLNYKPGQFMFIQLMRDGKLSSAHPFTISASPTAEYLSITPKKLGDFTMTIKDTRVGDRAFIDAPYGVFSLLNYDQDKQNRQNEHIFIAGGIGITPFISMLRYIYDHKLDKKITLFWANRSEENLCFQEELEKMEAELTGIKVVLVMSDQTDWQGEKGHIKAPMLLNYLENVEDKDFYICGPPAMSRATIAELKQLDVPSSRIHSELFEL